MNLAPKILGSSVVMRLKASAGAAVLTVGSDSLTRAQLAEVGCYNYVAARRLGQVLTEVVRARSLKDVYERIPPAALVVPDLGVVSLAVLGAAFEAKGIGGEAPLERYVEKHLQKDQDVVTFTTLKRRDHQAERAKSKRSRLRAS